MNKNELRFLLKNKIFLVLFFILIYLILYYDMYTCNFLSGDEAYQLSLNNWSFKEIVYYCSIDYHVPLFAFLVKIFSFLPMSSISSSRLLLSLIAIAHFFVAFFPMERLTNKKLSLIYSITFLLSPILIYFILQIRMYSLANLNLFCVFIYSMLVLKYNRKSDWIKLFIFSVLSCYSFLLTMCITFIILVFCTFYCFRTKKYDIMKKYIICSILVFLSFLPWIPILVKQMFNVQSSRYWEYFPSSFYKLLKSLICIFIISPVGNLYIADLIYYLFVILILLIMGYVIFNIFRKRPVVLNNDLNIYNMVIVIFSFGFILLYCYVNKTFAIRYFSIIYSLILFMVVYYLVNHYSYFCIIIFLVFLLIFYWNYSYVIYTGILNWNNELNELESELKKNSIDENIYVYYPSESTLEIMQSTSLNQYDSFIIYHNSCVTNVLNDYGLFGDKVQVFDRFSEIVNNIDNFYMIEMVTGDKSGLNRCTFNTLEKFNYSYLFVGEYYSGYNGDLFKLYKVNLNGVEE